MPGGSCVERAPPPKGRRRGTPASQPARTPVSAPLNRLSAGGRVIVRAEQDLGQVGPSGKWGQLRSNYALRRMPGRSRRGNEGLQESRRNPRVECPYAIANALVASRYHRLLCFERARWSRWQRRPADMRAAPSRDEPCMIPPARRERVEPRRPKRVARASCAFPASASSARKSGAYYRGACE